MIRILYKSFVPYLILLIAILVSVAYLDRYAQTIAEEPRVINIDQHTEFESQEVLSWEIDLGEITSEENDSLLQTGKDLYRQGAYREAMEAFSRRQLQKPNDYKNHTYLGLIALRINEFTKAEKHFETILQAEPDNYAAMLNMAIALSKKQQFKKATAYYDRAIALFPNNAKAYLNKGFLLLKNEEWELAAENFAKSAELSSGKAKAKALCQLGIVQTQLLDTLAATANFNEAILLRPDYELARINLAKLVEDPAQREAELLKTYQLRPNSFYANYYLAQFYVEAKDLNKAEYHYKNALDRNPGDNILIEELSNFLLRQGRTQEAALIVSGFAVGDTLPQSYFYQARIADREGENEKAIELYLLAIKKANNEYPEANLNMAILHKKMGNTQLAIESYKSAIAQKDKYPLAYYNLALLYTELGKTSLAIESYKSAIKQDPGSFKSYYNLGSLYREAGNAEAAISSFRKALGINPEYLKALSSLGVMYSQEKKFDLAILNYNKLLSYYPQHARGWYNLGLAYSKNNQTQKAIDAYNKVIEIEPGNIKARRNIGALYARTGQTELAIQNYETAVDLDTDSPELRYSLALQLQKAQNWGQAQYQYSKAIELNPKHLKAYNQLIKLHQSRNDSVGEQIAIYLKLQEFPDRKRLYQTAKKLNEYGENGLALEAFLKVKSDGRQGVWIDYWIGKAHQDLGNYNQALEYLQLALKEDPHHKFTNYRLGQVNDALGDTSQADIYYKKVLEMDPEFRIIRKTTTK